MLPSRNSIIQSVPFDAQLADSQYSCHCLPSKVPNVVSMEQTWFLVKDGARENKSRSQSMRGWAGNFCLLVQRLLAPPPLLKRAAWTLNNPSLNYQPWILQPSTSAIKRRGALSMFAIIHFSRCEKETASDETAMAGAMSWNENFVSMEMPQLSNVASKTKVSKAKPEVDPAAEVQKSWLKSALKDIRTAEELQKDLAANPLTLALSKQLTSEKRAAVKHYNAVLASQPPESGDLIAEAFVFYSTAKVTG